MSNVRSMDESAVGGRRINHALPSIPNAGARRLTVCHPVHGLAHGGLERQLIHVVGRLPASEFRHVVIVRGWDDAAAIRARAFGENVTVIGDAGTGADRDWPRKLATILETKAVDVLHVRGLTMLVDSVVAADWAGGIPIVSSFHGFEDAGASIARGIRRKLLREALLRCQARWAVGRGAADAATESFNLPAGAIDVIDNGVDTSVFRPAVDRRAVRARLDIGDDDFLLLCVGNIKPVKGHDVLIDAFAQVRPRATTKLVLIGADHTGGALPQRAIESCGAHRLRSVGPTDDVLPWYQAADAFVLPSRFEGLSNALLEAMACELPVIATAVGGNLDVIKDGENGLLVEADDAPALTRRIESVIQNAALRRRLGAAARKRVVARFDADAMVTAIAGRYRAAAASVASVAATRDVTAVSEAAAT